MEPQDESPRTRRRPVWLVGVAIVALGGVLFSLASLQSAKSSPPAAAGVDQGNPVAVALYQSMAQAESTQAQSSGVEMMNFAFSPASLTVSVGDTVTWTNHDSAPHNVVVTDGPVKFSSPLIQQGETYSYTFTQAGEYSYYCSVHPDMKATITVTGGGSTPTTEPTSTPTSKPTASPSTSKPSSSHSMPSSSAPAGSPGCVSTSVLTPIMDHIKAAHLETSPGQQVADILNLDQYIKTHTVWLEQVLAPVLDGDADQVVKDTLQPIVDHIKAAHLETSLSQQVTDALNLDQYLKTHTVWLEQVLTPLLGQVTC
ncbi:copper-binding protein [Amycolatopsis deserti]|uniref:Copper-binding protein n=1 Tax=Amycolatopsis deserti TaxID=185696 RepID=A0ABQ3IGN5_9PSEU|nr:cupredoxin family copper-binding protein [Amycolatopsis deserti]GHE83886.1 copper-binding protein [Amycolatopsis deserti]